LLKNISLVQFKNYREASFAFNERIIGICGNNGVGKTNLLDAIHYLCFSKSYFARSDQQNIQHGSAGFRIQGSFELDGTRQELVCLLRETGKKEFSINGNPYEKLSAHIGRFPCVIVAPDDVQIITGGSEERRRFLDALLCQLDPGYLQNLIEYNRVLQQRNGFLRSLNEKWGHDRHLLEVYDEQLLKPGQYVFEQRRLSMEQLLPLVRKYCTQIAAAEEPVELSYQSQLSEASFRGLLEQSREKDMLGQRTHAGIHKDDIGMLFKGQPFKQIASQGQRKSLLFALKWAEYEALKNAKGFAPVLLLDDVFEKLDQRRMYNLLDGVCRGEGQLFITDTHAGRIQAHLSGLPAACQIIQL
jgi:DNA replication and repair protein RecF